MQHILFEFSAEVAILEAEKHKEYTKVMITFETENLTAEITVKNIKDKLKETMKVKKPNEIKMLRGELSGSNPEKPVRIRYQNRSPPLRKSGI